METQNSALGPGLFVHMKDSTPQTAKGPLTEGTILFFLVKSGFVLGLLCGFVFFSLSLFSLV